MAKSKASDTGWVLAAAVADSQAAARTDSCGDMEQLELMDLIHVSDHDTRAAARSAADDKRAVHDGWTYVVMSRADFEAKSAAARSRAA